MTIWRNVYACAHVVRGGGRSVRDGGNSAAGRAGILSLWLRWALPSLGLLAAPEGDAATAETVFATASPSVVLIRNMEGHGSGVVLSANGTILTCYHVVNTPLPIKVTAEVSKAGSKSMMTFGDVAVLGVHKDYDLALLKVTLPSGCTLKPLAKAARPAKTGEECYVIGNPGGVGGEALRNSISSGIVSAVDRTFDGFSYIQTSAAINPGNSGGALLNKSGQLLGIVSFIVSDTEGIGFVIPQDKLRNSDFTEAVKRKPDMEKAIKYEKLGNRWWLLAQRLEGEARNEALVLACHAYRICLSAIPDSPAPYNNIGFMYFQLEDYESAKCYYSRAVELSGGKDPSYLKGLALSEAKTDNLAAANTLWKQAVLCAGEDDVRSECAESLAISAANTNDFASAAYLVKWANSLKMARPERVQTRSGIYQTAVNTLSEAQLRFLNAKSSNFSFEDLARFKAGTPAAAPGGGPAAGVASRVAPSASARRTPDSAGTVAAVPRKLIEQMLANAPEPPAEGLKKKIPEKAADCRPAFGGIYLVMKFREMNKLGIFNIAKAEFTKYLPISNPDCLYACGGKWLLVFDPNQKLFQLYDMNTLERSATKMSRLEGTLTDMEMGLMTSDRAVVSWAVSTGALDQRLYGVLEIPDMTVTPFRSTTQDFAQGFRNSSYRDNVHIRLDHTATRFVSWCTSHSPCGFIYGTIDGSSVTAHYEHESYGSLSLLPDRSRVVGSDGALLDAEGGVRHDFKQNACILFAVDGANMVLKVAENQVAVIDAINLTELQAFTLPFKMEKTAWNKDDLTVDRLVFASGYLNRAVFLDNADLQVYVFKLANGTSAAMVAEQIEGVPAGTKWTRALTHPAGTRIKVEDAPAGVVFDAAKMGLSWAIPSGTPAGSYQILISVTPLGKEEVYERITLTVR